MSNTLNISISYEMIWLLDHRNGCLTIGNNKVMKSTWKKWLLDSLQECAMAHDGDGVFGFVWCDSDWWCGGAGGGDWWCCGERFGALDEEEEMD
nr:hypothetical protein [Tanacetum cinerariifolium]